MQSKDTFIPIYNDLYQEILILYNQKTNYKWTFQEDFVVCINSLKNTNKIINKNYEFLDGIRRIRNIKIHDNFVNENLLVNTEIINKCIYITNQLHNPPKIKEYITSRNRYIYQIDISDDRYIYDIIHDMISKWFSYIPITKHKQIIWILDNTVLVSRLHQNKQFTTKNRLSDISESLFGYNNKHIYKIISQQELISDCIEFFDNYYNQNQKLLALIVTENWKITDPVLEIITAYDLNRIENNLL